MKDLQTMAIWLDEDGKEKGEMKKQVNELTNQIGYAVYCRHLGEFEKRFSDYEEAFIYYAKEMFDEMRGCYIGKTPVVCKKGEIS